MSDPASSSYRNPAVAGAANPEAPSQSTPPARRRGRPSTRGSPRNAGTSGRGGESTPTSRGGRAGRYTAASLTPDLSRQTQGGGAAPSSAREARDSGDRAQLTIQLAEINEEIDTLRSQVDQLRGQIDQDEKRRAQAGSRDGAGHSSEALVDDAQLEELLKGMDDDTL